MYREEGWGGGVADKTGCRLAGDTCVNKTCLITLSSVPAGSDEPSQGLQETDRDGLI